MHKGRYCNMNRAARRAYRKKVAAGLCSLTLLFSGIAVPQQSWIMGGTVAAYAASDVPVNATKVNISTLPIVEGKCIYVIEQDGDYHLTGSNLRNGVRVPTQIQVAEGVHANLYLDNVDINNENEQNTGTSQAWGVSTVPMNISGETVVYIVEDSQMQTSSNHAVDINAKASLTVEEGEKLTVSGQGNYKAGIKVSGTLLVNGGEIQATGGDYAPGIGFTEATDGRIVINGGKVKGTGGLCGAGIGAVNAWRFSNGQIEIHGGEVCAQGGSWAAGIGCGDEGSVSSVLIDGGTIEASGSKGGINAGDGKITVIKGGFIKEGTSIAPGTKDNDETLTGTTGASVTVLAGGIPDTTGQSVVAMSTYTVTDSVISNYKFYGTTDMKMSDTSRISAAIPAAANRVDVTLLNDSGELDGYTMQVSDGVLAVSSEYQPYKVTYRVTENGQQVDTMTAYTDSQGTVQLPSGLPVYDYTFMQNEVIFDGTGVTSDITVDVERTKHPYTVTYTGDYTGTDTTEYGGSVVLPATNAGVYLFTDENGQEFKGTGIYKDREISVDHRWKYQILDADNQVWKEGLAESDDTVTLPEDTASCHYRYYAENGQEITGSSVGLTKDTVIRTTEETRSYLMTYTGAHNETKTLFYGDSVIPATGEATWIYVDAEGRQVDTYKGEPVIYVIDGGVTDEDGVSYYQIQNKTDFQTFASYIQGGKSYLNGKLAADLNLGDYTPFSETYRGIFDGAGHTITYNIGTEDNPVAAGEDNKGMSLFQCANGATFKNLSVDGTIYTKEKYAGGIVGRWSGTGTFENCCSDVEIFYCPDSGDDATAGGFIGVCQDGDSSITIRNGLSTASISGVDNLSGQGGFIGWTDGIIVMDNCFADVAFQAGNRNPGETFVRNADPDSDNYYTNACGNSTQGTKVTSAEAVSAELAWKMNTNNGTMDNALAWAQADGTTHPLLADEEHKAVCRITYEVSGNAVGTAYSKKDGTVDVPAQNPVKEGSDFLGWYIGSTPVTATTVLTGDAVAIATFKDKESVAHAKDRLRTLLGDAVTADGQLDEETYTTASYAAYKEAWNAVAAAANAALETQTEAVEDIWQAIEAFETNYAAAKAKLTEADATAHLVYGAGTDAVTSEAVRYASGDAVELTAEAAGDGYVFRGWYRGERLDGSSVPATKNLSASVRIGTEDVTYQAVYARIPEITAPELVGTYGDKVSELVISGGAATVTAQGAQAEAVAGTWKLDENEETKNQLPQVKDTDSYTLTFVPEDALYYEKVSVEVIPQIAPKKITVTIKDASKNEGEENPAFTYEALAEGVLEGSDKAADLNIALSCSAVKASKAGSYPITGSYENDNYSITFVNGVLTVKETEPSPSPSATPSPGPSATPSPSPSVTPSPSPSVTPSPSPSVIPSPSVTPSPSNVPSPEPGNTPAMGDVDGNGKIDLQDAQLALQQTLKIIELDEMQKKRADVNEDGKIELVDAEKILRVALKIEKF